MKAVILAGGHGTRLSEETVTRPKPMVEIGGRPILWHIMKIYSHHGINDFVVCLGYKGYLIKEYFANYALHQSDVTFDIKSGSVEVHQNTAEPWRVTLVDTGQDTMTGGRLMRIRPYVADGTFCMTYGDGVSDVDITASIAFHRSHGKLATVTSVVPPGRFGLLDLKENAVVRMLEKPERSGSRINAGFFVLEPAALELIDGDSMPWERRPMERLAENRQLMAFNHDGYWQPMDTLRERQDLERLWSEGKAPWKLWKS